MATGRITKRTVDAIEPPAAKAFLWDDQLAGFGLQILPSGSKSYIFQYRLGGREPAKRRHTIGRHGSPWNPASARAEAERLAIMVAQGNDPVAVKLELKRERTELAFASYVGVFSKGYLQSHWKGWKQAEGLLRRIPTEILGDKPLPKILRRDIVEILDQLSDRPATARLTYAVLRKLFRWAEGRGDIHRGQSPLELGFPAPRGVKARDRVLSDRELVLVCLAADQTPYPFGPLFRILLGAGARREEASALSWSELDQCERLWVLPAVRRSLSHVYCHE